MWQLSLASNVTKHTPVYNLIAQYESTGNETKTLEISSPFTRWFDADGFFVAKPFQQWLATEIPLIGQVDPQNKLPQPDAMSNAGAMQSIEQQKYDSPKKSESRDPAPASTKSRKGKKASDR